MDIWKNAKRHVAAAVLQISVKAGVKFSCKTVIVSNIDYFQHIFGFISTGQSFVLG